jgi:uncharacterized protein (TIGR03086 family)
MTGTPLDLLDRSLGAVGELINKIRPEQWSAGTPCDHWAVRDVVIHLVGMNRVFAAMLSDSPQPERDPIPDDELASAYLSSSDVLLRVFAQPGVLGRTYESPMGRATGLERLSIRLYDLLAHGWDLARATEQSADSRPTPSSTRWLSRASSSMARAPGRFAPAQPVVADAPPIDRLAAYLGRRTT